MRGFNGCCALWRIHHINEAFLQERCFGVRARSVTSSPGKVTYYLPHGSILSPLFFSLFMALIRWAISYLLGLTLNVAIYAHDMV